MGYRRGMDTGRRMIRMIRYAGKDYDPPPTTFRVMHEVEVAYGAPWSRLTEAQKAVGTIWYAIHRDHPGLTPDALMDTDLEEFAGAPLASIPGPVGAPPSELPSE